MADAENVDEMVGTREAAAVATDSGGAVATESGGAVATESGGAVATESGGVITTGDDTVATAGDETAATGGIMFTDEGELEFDEDEMAALEWQRLVAELCPDSGSQPDFEASMLVSWQEISVAETTVDRKWSPTRMMMTV